MGLTAPSAAGRGLMPIGLSSSLAGVVGKPPGISEGVAKGSLVGSLFSRGCSPASLAVVESAVTLLRTAWLGSVARSEVDR